jgi:opacity protein-like surface antigen
VLIAVGLGICSPSAAAAPEFASSGGKWTLDGGQAWKDRVGPGLYAQLGAVACDDHWCEGDWDSEFFGSLDGTIGFFFRIVPNWAVFFDLGTALLPADRNHFDDDHGFLFRTVGGAEFHVPVTGWLDTYAGLGIGFAYLRFTGETGNDDVKQALLGIDFELRTGATVYLFSRAPGLGLGLYYRLGLAAWPTACVEAGDYDECDDIDDTEVDDDDLPFLHHLGAELRYGF